MYILMTKYKCKVLFLDGLRLKTPDYFSEAIENEKNHERHKRKTKKGRSEEKSSIFKSRSVVSLTIVRKNKRHAAPSVGLSCSLRVRQHARPTNDQKRRVKSSWANVKHASNLLTFRANLLTF